MLLLNEDAFIEWLEQFEYSDYLEALSDIASVYYGNKAISSQEKKRTANRPRLESCSPHAPDGPNRIKN